MTYQELSAKYNEAQLPITTTNNNAESVTIDHRTDHITYKDMIWNRPYFYIVTNLKDGYRKHEYIYKNGKTEQFYEMPNN